MNKLSSFIRKSVNWGGSIQKFDRKSVNWGGRSKHLKLWLVMALLLALTSPVFATPLQKTAQIQPVLLEMAAQQPDQIVSVIVQKTVKDDRVEKAISAFGGTITKDLHIINAFAAEMKAKDVAQLAKTDGVKWVSLDAPVVETGGPDGTVNTAALLNVYNKAIGADKLWAQGYQGSSVTVAIVDSGWKNNDDFRATPSGGDMRLKTRVGFNGNESNLDDHNGHGVHIAGIIGGNGRISKGKYVGIAPKVNFVSVKVNDSSNQASASGVVEGLQWIYDNRAIYNIRVVNLSLNSTVVQSYHNDPIGAAAEILWFNGIVVVVSAGNNGTATLYPPANDPFVITVGSADDKGTVGLGDDAVSSFSAYGITLDGFAKPDLVAPGRNIIAPLASGGAELPGLHPEAKVDGKTDYFKMSGTSMSAAVTTGAIALLLQDEPNLTPDQVKYRLKATAKKTGWAYDSAKAGAGYLDIYAAVKGTTTQSANTGITASQLLWTGPNPVNWGSVQWGSVQWGSVQWGSVQWGSVQWGSVQWGSTYWGP